MELTVFVRSFVHRPATGAARAADLRGCDGGVGWRAAHGLVGYAPHMTRRQQPTSQTLTAEFVDRLMEAVERTVEARTRVLTGEWLDVAMATHRVSPRPPLRLALATGTGSELADAQAVEPALAGAPDEGSATTRVRGRRAGARRKATATSPVTPLPLPSPEQQRRDAEFARLRALLKPTGQDDTAGAAETAAAAPSPLTVVAPPSDPLRLLEDEIRAQAHALAQLSQTSLTARIAAWAGRARSYEETTGNRVAAQLLLEKLRAFARAMDAGRIEALNGSWRTRDWDSYVRTNEALAEARPDTTENSEEPQPERSGEPDYRDVWSQPS